MNELETDLRAVDVGNKMIIRAKVVCAGDGCVSTLEVDALVSSGFSLMNLMEHTTRVLPILPALPKPWIRVDVHQFCVQLYCSKSCAKDKVKA